MGKCVISKEQREKIIKIIAQDFEYPWCESCAHYMGCAGGHNFGPPCSECQEGASGYEPDKSAVEANEKMFKRIEEVLNDDK